MITKSVLHRIHLFSQKIKDTQLKFIAWIRYFKYIHFQQNHRIINSGKSVYFSFSKIPGHWGRRLFSTLYFFIHEGYTVYVNVTPENFKSLSKYLYTQYLFNLDHILFTTNKKGKNCKWKFTDSDRINSEEWIRIRYDYFNKLLPQSYRVPLSFNPENLIVNHLVNSGINSHSDNRKVKLFFIGNLTPSSYSTSLEKFNCMSRLEVVKILKENLDDSILKFTDTIDELYSLIQGNTSVIICDGKKLPVWHEEYFKLLEKSHFFLSLSGSFMPLCHNIIEAMAAGCIPLLEYGSWFDPPLQNNVNCLTFHDQKSLLQQIQQILLMSNEDIQELRKNVLEYYNMYLSPKAVVHQMVSDVKNIYLVSGQDTVDLIPGKAQ